MALMVLGIVLFLLFLMVWDALVEVWKALPWIVAITVVVAGVLAAMGVKLDGGAAGKAKSRKKRPPASKRTAPRASPAAAKGRAMGNSGGSAMEGINVGLVIDEPWISKILSGEKCWEMRSTRTAKRERIALIRKGSGLVVGVTSLVNCVGPLSDQELFLNAEKHRVPIDQIGKWRYAWVLHNTCQLSMPVRYLHPKGAVKFVKLDPIVAAQVQSLDMPVR